MNLNDRNKVIYDKTSLYFGDADLVFQTARLGILITGAYKNTSGSRLYSPLTLLSIHNETIDLIDIGNLLKEENANKKRESKKVGVLKTLKILRKRIGGWDNFPSHLSTYEWEQPSLAINRFFLIHNIYKWKGLVASLYSSGIGGPSLHEMTDDYNIGLDVIELFRLQDAVWLSKYLE